MGGRLEEQGGETRSPDTPASERCRPLRCAFAARQHAEPLLIHRMSAQGDPTPEVEPNTPQMGSARGRNLY